MSQQPKDASNNFVEFTQVWGGAFQLYLQAVIQYDSQSGGFTVQMGCKIDEKNVSSGRRLQIVTTDGATIEIERDKQGKYTITNGSSKKITSTRTYLPNTK